MTGSDIAPQTQIDNAAPAPDTVLEPTNPPASAPATEPVTQSEPRPPSLGERVAAITSSRADLLARVNDERTQNAQLSAQLAALTIERDNLATRATTAETSLSEIQAQVTQLESEASTVAAGVTDQMVQLGVPRAELPSLPNEEQAVTHETLQAQLDKTTDPVERGKIAKRQAALMGF